MAAARQKGNVELTECDVVIVNYNAGEHLGRCVDSVFAFTGGASVSVVIVDNASTDGSLAPVIQAHPDVQVIANQDNRGFGSASNQGIEATSSSLVFLLNPDAEIEHGTLADLVALARDRPRVGAIGTLVHETDGSIYPSARQIPKLTDAVGHAVVGSFRKDNPWTRAYTIADWDRRTERQVDWVSGSCMLLRRSAIQQVGAFDAGYFMYAEDADLCTRLRRGGWEVLFSPAMEVLHARGISTGGSKRMVWEHSRSIERYIRTWVLTGWKRVFLPLAQGVLWTRAAIVARKATRP